MYKMSVFERLLNNINEILEFVVMNWHIEIKSETKVRDWVEDQIWVSSETLWLCQDII